MPRPTIKTPELQKCILELIIAGHNLTSICNQKTMPGRRTVYEWMLEDKKFYKAYQKAVWLRANETFLDVFEIADRPKENSVDVAADRLRVNTRLRAAALNPALKRMSERNKNNKKKDKPISKVSVEIVPSPSDLADYEEWFKSRHGSHPTLLPPSDVPHEEE